MTGQQFEQLIAIAQRKNRVDQTSTWSQGAKTYFDELYSELEEVREEWLAGQTEYLEEELGDVLWDYLNLLLCLDQEQQISIDKILARCIDKFDERVSGIEQGKNWNDIKALQKARRSGTA